MVINHNDLCQKSAGSWPPKNQRGLRPDLEKGSAAPRRFPKTTKKTSFLHPLLLIPTKPRRRRKSKRALPQKPQGSVSPRGAPTNPKNRGLPEFIAANTALSCVNQKPALTRAPIGRQNCVWSAWIQQSKIFLAKNHGFSRSPLATSRIKLPLLSPIPGQIRSIRSARRSEKWDTEAPPRHPHQPQLLRLPPLRPNPKPKPSPPKQRR